MAAATKSLSALLAQTSIDDHEESLQAANAAIKKSKTDTQAHHVRAVALLHLDRFEDALKVFEDVKELQDKARFEYAYTLYKTGNAAKAVEVAAVGSEQAGRGMKHVLAQAVSWQKVCALTEGEADKDRHTAQRISHRPYVYTGNWLVRELRMKNTIFASTRAPRTHS